MKHPTINPSFLIFRLQVFVVVLLRPQWLIWADPMVTSAPPCTSLLPTGAVLCVCVWSTITVHWNARSSITPHFSDIFTPFLPSAPSCNSLWASVCRPQKLVALFPYAAWSPAPLLIFSKQSKASTYPVDLHCVWLLDRPRWACVW